MTDTTSGEVRRLEELWSGRHGDEYIDRNWNEYSARGPWWQRTLELTRPRRVLEVGCNVGGNLRWIAQHAPETQIYGIDINRKAINSVPQFVPDGNFMVEHAYDLPFKDGWFDLAFTIGVLIHQPDESLEQVMGEIVRVSRRYVLAGEVYAPERHSIPYRGVPESLMGRDYGAIYQRVAPELRLVESGEMTKDEGFDNLRYWLFEK
jgi:pseudaminic acid biosynthesis-associated methylase